MHRELSDVIEKLGEMNVKAIASHLKSQGVRGRPRQPGQCAIARYVKQETGAGWVSVSPRTVEILPEDTELGTGGIHHFQTAVIPASVKTFIQKFDEHRYPDLET